jgi:hypothetical protein
VVAGATFADTEALAYLLIGQTFANEREDFLLS